MPSYKNIIVNNKKLPYINNNALAASGFFSRNRNQNTYSLNALPGDMLSEVFNQLSAKDLKALAETSSEFLKEMMNPLSRAYLKEIYIGELVGYLKKEGVYDVMINRFLPKPDEGVMSDDAAVEKALSRIIQFDNQTIKAGVKFYQREVLRGKLSMAQLDDYGQIKLNNNGEYIIDHGRHLRRVIPPAVIGGILIILLTIVCPAVAFVPLLSIGLLVFFCHIIIIAIHGLATNTDILKKKDPFEKIENNQEEASDILDEVVIESHNEEPSVISGEDAPGTNNEEEREEEDDYDDLTPLLR